MPNWCSGSLTIEGTKTEIEKFCDYFFYEDEELPKQYFARTFVNMNRNAFKEEFLSELEDNNKIQSVFVCLDFAWSCRSCMIEGYPQDNKGVCPTLMEVCKKCNVKVSIETDEEGIGFEEFIICDKGILTKDECITMPTYVCKKCNCSQIKPSYKSVEDMECWECSESDCFELEVEE